MPVERKIILCPYCGHVNPGPAERCGGCGGFFDPLSRRVTQQHMGPWFIRDSANPFRPGCTYEVLVKQIQRGKLNANTILRGPTTKQFWSVARHVPGISHLLGLCYQCSKQVDSQDKKCPHCGARFPELRDRQQLGLDPEDPGVFEEVARARAEEQAALNADAERSEASGTPAAPPQHPSMFAEPTAGPDTSEPTLTSRPAAKARVVSTSSADDDLFLPGSEPAPSPGAASVTERPAAVVQEKSSPTSADAMDWMTGSGAGAADSIETMGQFDQADRSSNLMVWVLVGMNVLLAIVVAMVILMRDSSGSKQPTPPPAQSPADTATPPPAASQSPAPSAADTTPRATIADAGRSWDEPTTSTPAAQTPKPKPQPAVVLPANKPAPTPKPAVKPAPAGGTDGGGSGVVSFFGIEVQAGGGATMSPQLAKELNQRVDKAREADQAGRYAEALKLLKQIKADLPEGVTAEGLDKSIAALQKRVDRQEIVKFLGQ